MPRRRRHQIPVDKIGEVIGPSGKMINAITEETGASISIEDDGTVFVGAADGPSAQAAIDRINAIANPQLPKIGERFLGTVVRPPTPGAFCLAAARRDGRCTSRSWAAEAGGKVEDVVKVGDKSSRVREIADIDNRGKISLIPVAGTATAPQETPHRLMPRPSAADRSAVRRTVLLPGGLRGRHGVRALGTASASVGLWVNVGSRDGDPRSPARHTSLEHLLFRGDADAHLGRHRPGGRHAVGGELNAFTSKGTHPATTRTSSTTIWTWPWKWSPTSSSTVCAPDDVELERDVVLEEIAMRDDDGGHPRRRVPVGDVRRSRSAVPVITAASSVSAMAEPVALFPSTATSPGGWSSQWPAASTMTTSSRWREVLPGPPGRGTRKPLPPRLRGACRGLT